MPMRRGKSARSPKRVHGIRLWRHFANGIRGGPRPVCRDNQPMDIRRSAAQVHRAGQRRLERSLHQSQSRRRTPSHPRCARSGSDPGRNSLRARVRGAHANSFVQPRGANSVGGSESRGRGMASTAKSAASTPACDAMRAVGQWNTAWDPFFELDPLWTDEFFAATISPSIRAG